MDLRPIEHQTLSDLVFPGSDWEIFAVGVRGGWVIHAAKAVRIHPKRADVKMLINERILTAQRSGQPRVFRKFETLVSYLKEIGVTTFKVDTNAYSTDSPDKVRRPDRSEALRNLYKAAATHSGLSARSRKRVVPTTHS